MDVNKVKMCLEIEYCVVAGMLVADNAYHARLAWKPVLPDFLQIDTVLCGTDRSRVEAIGIGYLADPLSCRVPSSRDRVYGLGLPMLTARDRASVLGEEGI